MAEQALTRGRGDQGSPAPLSASRLAAFFAPRSLAIVGASDTAYWSLNAFTNLAAIGFDGRVVPVNPRRAQVFGLVPTAVVFAGIVALLAVGAFVSLLRRR